VAQPVAVKWTPGQQVVWPTATTPAEKQQFSTEDFIRAVIDDVRTRHQLDDRFIFTLSWSSSGPAAYAISLQDRTPVTGSFVAMSVFKPDQLPSLERAKGHPYFLYHSPADRVCPFRMAEAARDALAKQGATVQLATYEGGHGWRGNVYADIRRGIEWLERSVPVQAKPGQTPESR
jgi:predicted esterase